MVSGNDPSHSPTTPTPYNHVLLCNKRETSNFLLDTVRLWTEGPTTHLTAFLDQLTTITEAHPRGAGRHRRKRQCRFQGVALDVEFDSRRLGTEENAGLSIVFQEPTLTGLRCIDQLLRSLTLRCWLSKVDFTLDMYSERARDLFDALRWHLIVGYVRGRAVLYGGSTFYVNDSRNRAVLRLYLCHLKHGGPPRVRLELVANREKLKRMGVPDLEALADYAVADLPKHFHLGFASFDRAGFETRFAQWHLARFPKTTPRVMAIIRDWCEAVESFVQDCGLMKACIKARADAQNLGGWARVLNDAPVGTAACFFDLFDRGSVEDCLRHGREEEEGPASCF